MEFRGEKCGLPECDVMQAKPNAAAHAVHQQTPRQPPPPANHPLPPVDTTSFTLESSNLLLFQKTSGGRLEATQVVLQTQKKTRKHSPLPPTSLQQQRRPINWVSIKQKQQQTNARNNATTQQFKTSLLDANLKCLLDVSCHSDQFAFPCPGNS